MPFSCSYKYAPSHIGVRHLIAYHVWGVGNAKNIAGYDVWYKTFKSVKIGVIEGFFGW